MTHHRLLCVFHPDISVRKHKYLHVSIHTCYMAEMSKAELMKGRNTFSSSSSWFTFDMSGGQQNSIVIHFRSSSINILCRRASCALSASKKDEHPLHLTCVFKDKSWKSDVKKTSCLLLDCAPPPQQINALLLVFMSDYQKWSMYFQELKSYIY